MNRKELDSMIYLLTDPDRFTYLTLMEGFERCGLAGVDYALDNVYNVLPPAQSSDAFDKLESIATAVAFHVMRDALKTGYKDFDEDLGIYLLNRIVRPAVLYADFSELLYEYATEVYESEFRDDMTMVERVEMFNYLFFVQEGFQIVSRKDGYFPCYALTDVMLSRKADGLMMHVLYMFLASMLGMDIRPLYTNKSGYYIACMEKEKPLFTVSVDEKGKITGKPDPEDLSGVRQPEESCALVYLYLSALRERSEHVSTLEARFLDEIHKDMVLNLDMNLL